MLQARTALEHKKNTTYTASVLLYSGTHYVKKAGYTYRVKMPQFGGWVYLAQLRPQRQQYEVTTGFTLKPPALPC